MNLMVTPDDPKQSFLCCVFHVAPVLKRPGSPSQLPEKDFNAEKVEKELMETYSMDKDSWNSREAIVSSETRRLQRRRKAGLKVSIRGRIGGWWGIRDSRNKNVIGQFGRHSRKPG
jgi:hypothetical protein